MDSTIGQVYEQQLHGYRGTKQPAVEITDTAVVQKSHDAAQAMAAARTEIEGRKVSIAVDTFDARGSDFEPGNIPEVALFVGLIGIPWIYCEDGAKGGYSQADQDAYATGLVAGIEAAVPLE